LPPPNPPEGSIPPCPTPKGGLKPLLIIYLSGFIAPLQGGWWVVFRGVGGWFPEGVEGDLSWVLDPL